MQTTLLGLAIALILALVSAIVAPLVVDWNHYRGTIAAEASRLTGLNVHVNGGIDARLLPTPEITLHDVDIGGAGRPPQLHAGMFKLELALGPLMRGQLQASELDVIGPEINLALDRSGAIDLPSLSASFRRRGLAISHLSIENGRVTLTDAASGSKLSLGKFWFDGDVEPLDGSFGGQGAAVVNDQIYGYRITGSPAQKGGGTQIRLGVDPGDLPLTTQFDGGLTFHRGVPHFDGTLALARPVGAALANGKRVVNAPWRATGSIKATPAAAALTHVDFRYGPEDRAVELTGSGELTFGAHPHLTGKIASLQVNVDQALAEPSVTGRPPLVSLRSFLQAFVSGARLPVPARLDIGIDTLTLGGTTLGPLRGKLAFDRTSWSLRDFEFHVPGMSDVKLSGRLGGGAQGFTFTGPATLASADAGTLLAWLDGGGAGATGAPETLNASGTVTIASDRMAVDALSATLNQETIAGRLAYNWPKKGHPAGLDAELRAPELNLDGFANFARQALGKNGFALPQEATLALNIGKATYAGVAAEAVNAAVKVDAGKLQIDRFSIGNLAGAKLDIGGRIDELSSQPRGRLTLDLEAGALDGLAEIVAKFAPSEGDFLRRFAGRLAPAQVHASLDIERGAGSGSTATLEAKGNLAAMRFDVGATAAGTPAHWRSAAIGLQGRIDTDDGTALVKLLGLEGILAVDQLPAHLTLSAAGPLDGDIEVASQVAASGLGADAKGTLHFDKEWVPAGTLQVSAAAGDLRPLQRAMTGQTGAAVPVSGSAVLSIDGRKLSFTQASAKISGAALHGRLALDLTDPVGIGGDIDADRADAASVAALLIGAPRATKSGAASWSSEKIGGGAFAAIDGAVKFRIGRAAFTPALIASNLTGVAHFTPSAIAFDKLGGSLAGGALGGALAFRRNADDLDVHADIALVGADAAPLLGPSLDVTGGKLTAAFRTDSSGSTPLDLIESLQGSGTLKLKNAQFAGLDPAAFGAATQAAGDSAPVDLNKVNAAIAAALANGHVELPQSETRLAVTSGAIDLNHVALPAKGGGTFALDGVLDFGRGTIDAQATLSEPSPSSGLISTRPALSVAVAGPLGSPQRTLDVSALTSWLTLRAAELQTRRVDSIEADRQRGPVAQEPHPAAPDVRAAQPGIVVDSALPPSVLIAPPPGTSGIERLRPAAPASILPGQSEQPGRSARSKTAPAPPSPLALRPSGTVAGPRTLTGTASNGAAQ